MAGERDRPVMEGELAQRSAALPLLAAWTLFERNFSHTPWASSQHDVRLTRANYFEIRAIQNDTTILMTCHTPTYIPSGKFEIAMRQPRSKAAVKMSADIQNECRILLAIMYSQRLLEWRKTGGRLDGMY